LLIDSNQPRAKLQAQVREVSAIPADSTVGTVPLQRGAASAEIILRRNCLQFAIEMSIRYAVGVAFEVGNQVEHFISAAINPCFDWKAWSCRWLCLHEPRWSDLASAPHGSAANIGSENPRANIKFRASACDDPLRRQPTCAILSVGLPGTYRASPARDQERRSWRR
jgi:hypothetical protein